MSAPSPHRARGPRSRIVWAPRNRVERRLLAAGIRAAEERARKIDDALLGRVFTVALDDASNLRPFRADEHEVEEPR